MSVHVFVCLDCLFMCMCVWVCGCFCLCMCVCVCMSVCMCVFAVAFIYPIRSVTSIPQLAFNNGSEGKCEIVVQSTAEPFHSRRSSSGRSNSSSKSSEPNAANAVALRGEIGICSNCNFYFIILFIFQFR